MRAASWPISRLEQALSRVRARDRIRLLGYVPDHDLPPLLCGSLGLALSLR